MNTDILVINTTNEKYNDNCGVTGVICEQAWIP